MKKQLTTEEIYQDIMKTIRKRKAELGLSNSDIAKRIGESRTTAIRKLNSKNIQFKGFIDLARAVKLSISVSTDHE